MPWNVYGHEWAAELLQQHAAQNQVRHAYLLAGPPGVGRRTLALRFAQAVNCTQPPQPGEPCGACRTCKQIEAMQHPDLSVVQAEREGGALLIEQVRSLQQILSLAPYQARYRVALMLRFQEANDNAANALLKTLEEAPARVILLLTVDSPEDVLPTIASRCEVLRLRALPVPAAAARLQQHWQMDAAQADLLAHISGGRLGYALRLAGDKDLREKREALLDDLLRLLDAPIRERFAYAEKKSKVRGGAREEREAVRAELRLLFSLWLGLWRDVLLRSAGASAPLTNVDYHQQVDNLAVRFEPAAVRARMRTLEAALARLPNANLQLMLENLLLEM